MQAILTKYHGATNTKPARVTARSASGQAVTIPYDPDVEPDQAHRKAADALCIRLGWRKDWLVAGSLVNGYAFVFAPPRDVAGHLNANDIYAAVAQEKASARLFVCPPQRARRS